MIFVFRSLIIIFGKLQANFYYIQNTLDDCWKSEFLCPKYDRENDFIGIGWEQAKCTAAQLLMWACS